MNFRKASIFQRDTEKPEEQNDSGGMLAVWGSPGSGKTVTAVKIAKMLSARKKNVILLLCDMAAPMLPCICPADALESNGSLAGVLAAARISENLIKHNLVTFKRNSCLAVLGLLERQNEYSTPPFTQKQVVELLDGLRQIAPYVIVDCGSYIANDILSAVALMEADSILRLANCDPKSVNYFASQLPLLDGPEWDMDKQYKVASNVKPYWNPGMDGVRVSVIHADSQAVTGTVFDLTNKVPSTGLAHFGKVSKLSYNTGKSIAPKAGNYTYINPSQSLPKIISTSSSKASIAAIRSYFTDEQVIRSIAGYAGMDFDTLIGGDYKLVVEPLAYLCYNGQQFAMTATEAALYDQVVNGDLRKKLGTLTHKNLPLAIFLEEADLGYAAWSGSRTEKASNGDIISSLGIGIVRFNEVTTPPEPGEYDYEYRVNTEVITSVEVRGGQSDPDNPVSVRFNIQGRTYTVSNVYYPDGDSQLAWVRWRTPAEPCVITISVSVYGGGSAQGTITCNIVDLDGNDPPNPLADDRNDAFRLSSIAGHDTHPFAFY